MAKASAVVEAQRKLNEARAKRLRDSLGPPLSLTDEERDRLATGGLGVELIPELEAYVRDAAGRDGLALMQATDWEERS